MRLVDADELVSKIDELSEGAGFYKPIYEGFSKAVKNQPTIDAAPVAEIKDYLQKRLDEWEALGDRKFEPANMWGYNFIMACFDDLERKDGEG